MQINIQDMIGKVRVAIDEQVPVDTESDFTERLDEEIRHALRTACIQLCGELPLDMLLPTTLANTDIVSHVMNSDGTGMISIPHNFLRLVKFKLNSWVQSVRQLTDPLSNEGRMQASPWTRGTPEKPKAMLGETRNGYRMMEYYTAGKVNDAYDHTVECFCYVGSPSEIGSTMDLPIKEDCIPLIIYRAAGIVMEGKQNGDLADRFYKLSTAYAVDANQ